MGAGPAHFVMAVLTGKPSSTKINAAGAQTRLRVCVFRIAVTELNWCAAHDSVPFSK